MVVQDGAAQDRRDGTTNRVRQPRGGTHHQRGVDHTSARVYAIGSSVDPDGYIEYDDDDVESFPAQPSRGRVVVDLRP